MINRKFLFDSVKASLFGGKYTVEQIQGIDGIINAYEKMKLTDKRVLAYALATAYHETGRHMSPIKETVMPSHKNKNPSDDTVISRLDAWARRIGRTRNIYWRKQAPYNKAYFGRGQVQLTWKENYEASSKDVGIDLVKDPDQLLNPEVSAKLLLLGILDGRWNSAGHGIVYYLDRNDLRNARRTVNITDQWEPIATYYQSFLKGIK